MPRDAVSRTANVGTRLFFPSGTTVIRRAEKLAKLGIIGAQAALKSLGPSHHYHRIGGLKSGSLIGSSIDFHRRPAKSTTISRRVPRELSASWGLITYALKPFVHHGDTVPMGLRGSIGAPVALAFGRPMTNKKQHRSA